jgi:hypothetical protein
MISSGFRVVLRVCAATFLFGFAWAQEASVGGAREALGRAERLSRGLSSEDPLDMRSALDEASKLIPVMQGMTTLLKEAESKIASIRAEFEKKSLGTGKAAQFYESQLKLMRDREGSLSDLRLKVDQVASKLKESVEKALKNPEVQDLIKRDELLRKTNETIERLKKLDKSLNP